MRYSFLFLLLLLSGCGFHLRGSVELPEQWLTLHLQSPSPNGELAGRVRAALGKSGVQWLAPGSANYILQLGSENFTQRNLSIGSNARATEFELKLSASLRVLSGNGEELMPKTELTTTRIMSHDPENVSGKVEESNMVRAEMRVELVQQILRRIRFLATN